MSRWSSSKILAPIGLWGADRETPQRFCVAFQSSIGQEGSSLLNHLLWSHFLYGCFVHSTLRFVFNARGNSSFISPRKGFQLSKIDGSQSEKGNEVRLFHSCRSRQLCDHIQPIALEWRRSLPDVGNRWHPGELLHLTAVWAVFALINLKHNRMIHSEIAVNDESGSRQHFEGPWNRLKVQAWKRMIPCWKDDPRIVGYCHDNAPKTGLPCAMLDQKFESSSIPVMWGKYQKENWSSKTSDQDWEESEGDWKAGFKLYCTAIFPKKSGLPISWIRWPISRRPF